MLDLKDWKIVGSSPHHDQVKPKTIKICVCCLSAKHAVLRRKSKDWLARNQNNVSEWGDVSSTIKIQLSMLV